MQASVTRDILFFKMSAFFGTRQSNDIDYISYLKQHHTGGRRTTCPPEAHSSSIFYGFKKAGDTSSAARC